MGPPEGLAISPSGTFSTAGRASCGPVSGRHLQSTPDAGGPPTTEFPDPEPAIPAARPSQDRGKETRKKTVLSELFFGRRPIFEENQRGQKETTRELHAGKGTTKYTSPPVPNALLVRVSTAAAPPQPLFRRRPRFEPEEANEIPI